MGRGLRQEGPASPVSAGPAGWGRGRGRGGPPGLGQEARPAPAPYPFPPHRLPSPSARAAWPRPAPVAPCAFLTFSLRMASFWALWGFIHQQDQHSFFRGRSTRPGSLGRVPGSALPAKSSLSRGWDRRGGLQAACVCAESGLGQRGGLSPRERLRGEAFPNSP